VASRRLLFLLLFAALAGCSGPATATPTPSPPAVLVTSPALEPLVTGWLKAYAAASGPLAFDLDIRAPSAELGTAETRIQGTQPEGAAFATPLGREAVAVIVHPSVTKRDFTLAELADIFSGRTAGWDAMGGGSESVQPVIPLPEDSLRLAFQAAVMGTSHFASGARLAPTPATMVALVAQTPGAIGLAPLSQPDDGVKLARVDGQLADPDRLDSTAYPLTFEVIAAGAGVPEGPIYDFLLWRQAQEPTAQP